MIRYTQVKPSREIAALIELTARIACRELGCSLPDQIVCVLPSDNGDIEGPRHSLVNGWRDDGGVYIVVDRPTVEIVRTTFHECAHHYDALRYTSLDDAINDLAPAEQRATAFALEGSKDLPIAYSYLMAALNERLHRLKYPRAHAESFIRARQELMRTELDDFEPYGDPN
jgi:hypothetical protein